MHPGAAIIVDHGRPLQLADDLTKDLFKTGEYNLRALIKLIYDPFLE